MFTAPATWPEANSLAGRTSTSTTPGSLDRASNSSNVTGLAPSTSPKKASARVETSTIRASASATSARYPASTAGSANR